MQPPSISLLRYLQTTNTEHNVAADIFEGLIVAIQTILDHCISKKTKKELKYAKTIYMFTDAETPIDNEGFEAVAKQIREKDIDFVLWFQNVF
jgi:ATP-dependent DNA helicase 2 subunit 2